MAERLTVDQLQLQLDPQLLSPQGPREDMIACVLALEAALLPCLPARELQAIDRSPHLSHQNLDASIKESDKALNPGEPPSIQRQDMREQLPFDFSLENFGLDAKGPVVNVERHARDFMESAKKLQLYFIGLQREDQPTKAEMLRQEIAAMEEELKKKTEIIQKQERQILGCRKALKDQLDRHNTELERV